MVMVNITVLRLRWRQRNPIVIVDALFCLLLSFYCTFPSKFALNSPLWKQSRLNWDFNVMCRMVSICIRLLGFRQSRLKLKNTALRNYAKTLQRHSLYTWHMQLARSRQTWLAALHATAVTALAARNRHSTTDRSFSSLETL